MARTLSQYEELLSEGLRPDPAQRAAAEALDALETRLRDGKRRSLPWQPPREASGLYLYGGVGAGKTLLMDLFARSAPDLPTRRVHYHVFMEEMHGFIANWRDMGEAERRKHPNRGRRASLDDPIPHAAKAAFQEAELLCLDEMQVTDIADAMLLGRLFENYFARGGTLVVTSNRHPTDLYKDGINRELFLPFIDLIQEVMTVHEVKAAEDYRLAGFQKHGLYFTPLDEDADRAMDAAFEAQAMGEDAHPETLFVSGRKVVLSQATGDVARASFADLCENPLGASDYLAITRRFATVFLDRIPLLSPENADAASRFRTLIDALYDHRCKLVCSAAAEPDKLYTSGKLAFEFERTASRLFEMRTEAYLREEHRCEERQNGKAR
ncbi:cell division protein ZapE [Parvularcula lutaonensis]|uniref:Cell division protein ZapE n=1 Tax=Parvularcula lutaonensis TaxID=491923 RepID=A0ABV7MAS2_9PROT|nr:cell division protein ZapE [Parvularcula lutaonensis]GGY45826.1 cell division protein ZapE [Parvularcula lutaonensis]